MNSKTVFAIIVIVASIGVIVPSISSNIVFADKGGIPNNKALPNPLLHCTEHPEQNICNRHYPPV
jgi:hypothetical protein